MLKDPASAERENNQRKLAAERLRAKQERRDRGEDRSGTAVARAGQKQRHHTRVLTLLATLALVALTMFAVLCSRVNKLVPRRRSGQRQHAKQLRDEKTGNGGSESAERPWAVLHRRRCKATRAAGSNSECN